MRIKLEEIWHDEEIVAKENGEQFILPADILKVIVRDSKELGFLNVPSRFYFEMTGIYTECKFYSFEVTQAKGAYRFKIVKQLLNYFKSLGFEESDSYYNKVLFPKSQLENLVTLYKIKNLL
jgi:hypothetical protein